MASMEDATTNSKLFEEGPEISPQKEPTISPRKAKRLYSERSQKIRKHGMFSPETSKSEQKEKEKKNAT